MTDPKALADELATLRRDVVMSMLAGPIGDTTISPEARKLLVWAYENAATLDAILRAESASLERVEGMRELTHRHRQVLRTLADGKEALSQQVGERMGYTFPASLEACRANLNDLVRLGYATKDVRRTAKTRNAFYVITEAGRAALGSSRTGGRDG